MEMVSKAMPITDAWDWPLLFYVGTVMLNRSEASFWKMKPRRLNALSRVHIELNDSENKKDKTGYIDNIL